MHRDSLGPQALREGPKAKVSNVKCSGVWVTPKTKSLKSGLLLIQTLAACCVFGEQTLESEGNRPRDSLKTRPSLYLGKNILMAQFQDQRPGWRGNQDCTRQTGTGYRAQKQAPRTFAPGERGETAELTSPL